jgi:hypothetical protein
VNNQAPAHVLVNPNFSTNPLSVISPDEPLDRHMGVDRMTRFDVYVSSKRAYFFLDGAPAGCTEYPSALSLGGSVSITSETCSTTRARATNSCALTKPYPFLHAHQCSETKRHFDDVGFKNGVPAPAWDESVRPCGVY